MIDPTKGLDVEERSQCLTSVRSDHSTAATTACPIIDADRRAVDSQPISSAHPRTSIPSREDVAIAGLVHSESVTAIQRIVEGITSAVRLDSPALCTMVARIHDRLIENRSAMMTATRLQQLQRFDAHIFSHVVNVSVLAMAIGIEQDLDAHTLEEIALGALLHDIGEVRLPLNLFRKGDALTTSERSCFTNIRPLG